MLDRNAVKVGLVSFFMIGVLAALLIWKSGIFYRLDGYEVIGEFSSVNGLVNGADVRYRGSMVGKVFDIEPTPKAVRVHFRVLSNIQIPKNSVVKIYFDGLIGEKFLNIIPNADETTMVRDGDTLNGTVSAGLAEFVEVGAQNLETTKALLDTYKEVLVQPEMLGSLKNIVQSVDQLTRDLTLLSGALSGRNGSGSIPLLIDNLTKTTTLVRKNADLLLGDSQLAANSRSIVANLAEITGQVNGLLNGMARSTDSTGNIYKLNAIIDNAYDISSGLRGSLGTNGLFGPGGPIKTISSINLSGEAYVLPVANPGNAALYEGFVDSRLGGQFLRTGLAGSKGSSNPGWTLQYGSHFGPASARIGFQESQLSVGVDYSPVERAKVSVDVSNSDSPAVSVRGRYRLGDHLGVVLNVKKYTQSSASDQFGLGVSYSTAD